MKRLLLLLFAATAFSFSSQAQCPTGAGITLVNTQACGLCFTVIEYDANCNPCPAITVCIPPGAPPLFVPSACGGQFETVMVSDVPPPFPPAPCSAVGNAPWSCCVIPGPPVVPWNMCSPCGGGLPVMMMWAGGPAAPMVTV